MGRMGDCELDVITWRLWCAFVVVQLEVNLDFEQQFSSRKMYPFLKSHQYQRLDKVESPSLVQRIWQSGKIHIIYISLFLAFITSYKWYPSASGSQYGPEAFHR